MYKQYGTFQLLIEVGTRNLHPEEALMLDTIDRASNGVWWMMNRALLFSMDVPSNSLLTGHTIDAHTGEPISAEIIIQERHAPWFHPRTSFEDTGRFYKALPMGSYTFHARKKGYWDRIIESVSVNNGSWTTITVELEPKAEATLHGMVRSGSEPIPARIIIHDVIPDTLIVDGEYIYNGYEGDYEVEIYSDGYYPYLGTITLQPGAQQSYINLSPENVIFSENWESGTEAWEINGPWVLQDELSASGNAITDSWGGRRHYAPNCDVWIQTVDPIQIPEGNTAMLYFDSHLYTEWDFDPVTVEVSLDGENFTEIFRKSGRYDWWQKEYISLAEYGGQSIYLRFRLQDDSIADELTDPGWTLDNIRLVTGTATDNMDQVHEALHSVILYPNYPNPFNPETTIRYSLSSPQELSIEIFNIKGQRVASYNPGIQSAGDHSFVWRGKDDAGRNVSSGIYYYRLSSDGYHKTRKMVLMK
jgi:hypothetical protein